MFASYTYKSKWGTQFKLKKIQLFISAEHDDGQSISFVEGIAAIVR